MKNKFGAVLTKSYKDYETLSSKYNIPVSEIIQMDFNRCGVYLPNNEVRENFRVRFKGNILDDYTTWYALPVMAEKDTPFKVQDGVIYFKNKEIGYATTELFLDTCESSYQRGPNLLNLNSRSRSNCGGCTACIHNYHSFYDDTVLKDKKQIRTEEDFIEFLTNKNIDVKSLKQIAVVTGLFGSEDNVVEHMTMISKVAKERGFTGELMYFGCEVNSDEALQKLANLGNFKLIYAIDNFTKREMILSKKKADITLEFAMDTLQRAKDMGIKTSYSYIAGIDSYSKMFDGFKKINTVITDFPIINIYQIQLASQASILNKEATILEYYIAARLYVEHDINFKLLPKRWANYRPLWYGYYRGQRLEDNSFGQLE